MKLVEFAKRVDLDEATHNEVSHLDLHCLPSSLEFSHDIAGLKAFRKVVDINFVDCFFCCFKPIELRTECWRLEFW